MAARGKSPAGAARRAPPSRSTCWRPRRCSATTLARAIGMSVKCATELLDRFVAAEMAVEVTHRSARRLFGLRGMAPLGEAVRPPYRPDPNRGRGRPPIFAIKRTPQGRGADAAARPGRAAKLRLRRSRALHGAAGPGPPPDAAVTRRAGARRTRRGRIDPGAWSTGKPPMPRQSPLSTPARSGTTKAGCHRPCEDDIGTVDRMDTHGGTALAAAIVAPGVPRWCDSGSANTSSGCPFRSSGPRRCAPTRAGRRMPGSGFPRCHRRRGGGLLSC